MGKKFGDRRDGKKLKVSAMNRLMTYTKDRCDADVYINKKVDVTKLVEYVKNKKQSEPDLTYFYAFVTAIAKIVFNRPKLNTFIVNHTFYQRNDVVISYVAKVNFEDEAKELMQCIKIDPKDNLSSIKTKFKASVEKVRSNKQSSSDNSLDILDKCPRWLLTWVVAPIVLWLDKHDLLPASMVNEMLYYSTVIVSNLGSINCGAIYHNLVNFGSNGILITIGDIHKEPVVLEDGEIVAHDVIEFGVTLDERIADGVYLSKAVNMIDYILQNPESLDDSVDTIIKEKAKFKY